MRDDERIDEIIGTWCETRDRGDSVDPEELCRQHPEFADELRARFVTLEILEQACAEPEPDPSAPERIGDYRILRELGRGGMGVVYEAQQTSLERRVALKVLSPSITGTAQAVKRFQREAQAAARLHHTNIVPVHGMGQHAGYWYYAMELVQGRPLSVLIAELRGLAHRPTEESLARRSGVTSTEQKAGREAAESTTGGDDLSGAGTGNRAYFIRVAEMFAGVAEALELAHQGGVIHRDIKPSNLLLDTGGTLKIVDFGLARFEDESMSMTVTGDLLGTPNYMSPEQAMAKRINVDRRTDVYSMGATLYEVLTLRPPFQAKNIQELCSQIITKDPLLPRRTNRRIPRDLETIVLKAMEKDRDRRYASAGALARDLRLFAEGGAICARRIGPVGRAWRRARRHPVRMSLAAGLLLALGVSLHLGLRAAAEAERRRALDYARLCARAEQRVISALAVPEQQCLGGETPESIYGAAIDLLPDRYEAYLGRALVPVRQIGDRLADLDAARARGLPARTWHLARSDLLRAFTSEAEEAEFHANRASEIPGESPMDLYLKARQLAAESNWGATRKVLTQVLAAPELGPVLRYFALLLRSQARTRDGAHAHALEDLIQMRAMGDRGPELAAKIATAWRRKGDEESAERHLHDAFEEMGRTGTEEGWVILCGAVHDNGDYDWLERAARTALGTYPSSARLRYGLADALRHRGRFGDALANFNQALELDPDNCAAHVNRAYTLTRLGQYGDALDAADRALELDPQSKLARAHRATALGMLERFDEALVACDHALELDPNNDLTQFNRGVSLAELGRPEDALKAYDRAIALNDKDARYHGNRGGILGSLAQFQAALQAYDRAIELDAEEPSYHRGRGKALFLTGESGKALEALERAIELGPDSAQSHFDYGAVLGRCGRPDDALAAFNRALELDPNSADALINRGALRNRLGRLSAALADFDGALRLGSDSAMVHQNRSIVLNRLGQFEDALTACNCAVARDPRNAGIHYHRGNLLGCTGDADGAIEAYREAIRLNPGFAEAHCNLAGQLLRQENFEEALHHYRKGHELGSARPHRKYSSRSWVESAERMAKLGARLEPLLAGELSPRNVTERIDLARILKWRARYAESARMYVAAFSESVELRDDLGTGNRYEAACVAVLASTPEWRNRALRWLRADLKARQESAEELTAKLETWRRDPDLEDVRDRVDELPAVEQADWVKLWSEVNAILDRTGQQ